MDPAETEQLRHALSTQGARVGQHERALVEIMDSLKDLSAGVNQLSGRMDKVVTMLPTVPPPDGAPASTAAVTDHPPASPVPLGFPSNHHREPYIPTPAQYAEMRKVFDHPVRGREASNRLLSLRQGSAPVSSYAVDFRILAAQSGWDEVALQGVFLSGLTDKLKDELAVRDETSSLEELIDLATRLDNRLRERCREREGTLVFRTRFLTPRSGFPSADNSPTALVPVLDSSLSDSPGEPMQLGRMRLTPSERQRRVRQGLCVYCGQAGHFLAACPTLPKDQAHTTSSTGPPTRLTQRGMLRWQVNSFPLQVLIDSGADDNFIDF
ncbi:hypothetical protein COCON_G00105940 [Conger conger]|uniref:CCHC-type domain-containing protein n=1 Tax=Conger conger TaxID=82655 RepID=A0A9Q1DIM0_CONCO|nr:hypothetical protein COCON_G00105940 [Conger conger]